MTTHEEYLSEVKFVIDVRGLTSEAKEAVWTHYWDHDKSPDLCIDDYNGFEDDNFFTVFKSNATGQRRFRGGICRQTSSPTEYGGEAILQITFKPVINEVIQYHVLGLDQPEVIEIAGTKYRRIS